MCGRGRRGTLQEQVFEETRVIGVVRFFTGFLSLCSFLGGEHFSTLVSIKKRSLQSEMLNKIKECFRIMMRSEYLLGMLLWARKSTCE